MALRVVTMKSFLNSSQQKIKPNFSAKSENGPTSIAYKQHKYFLDVESTNSVCSISI